MIAIRPKSATMEAWSAIEADYLRIKATLGAGMTNDEQVSRASQVAQRMSRNAQSLVLTLRGEIADAKARERRDGEQRRRVG